MVMLSSLVSVNERKAAHGGRLGGFDTLSEWEYFFRGLFGYILLLDADKNCFAYATKYSLMEESPKQLGR